MKTLSRNREELLQLDKEHQKLTANIILNGEKLEILSLKWKPGMSSLTIPFQYHTGSLSFIRKEKLAL